MHVCFQKLFKTPKETVLRFVELRSRETTWHWLLYQESGFNQPYWIIFLDAENIQIDVLIAFDHSTWHCRYLDKSHYFPALICVSRQPFFSDGNCQNLEWWQWPKSNGSSCLRSRFAMKPTPCFKMNEPLRRGYFKNAWTVPRVDLCSDQLLPGPYSGQNSSASWANHETNFENGPILRMELLLDSAWHRKDRNPFYFVAISSKIVAFVTARIMRIYQYSIWIHFSVCLDLYFWLELNLVMSFRNEDVHLWKQKIWA